MLAAFVLLRVPAGLSLPAEIRVKNFIDPGRARSIAP
jgi:hypothetical protein